MTQLGPFLDWAPDYDNTFIIHMHNSASMSVCDAAHGASVVQDKCNSTSTLSN